MEWNCISFYFYVVFCLVCLCFALFIDMSTNTADCANPPISLSLSSTADYLSLSPCLSHSLQRLRINLNRNQAKINRAKELHTKNARAAKCERHLSRKVGNTGAGAPGHPGLKALRNPSSSSSPHHTHCPQDRGLGRHHEQDLQPLALPAALPARPVRAKWPSGGGISRPRQLLDHHDQEHRGGEW